MGFWKHSASRQWNFHCSILFVQGLRKHASFKAKQKQGASTTVSGEEKEFWQQAWCFDASLMPLFNNLKVELPEGCLTLNKAILPYMFSQPHHILRVTAEKNRSVHDKIHPYSLSHLLCPPKLVSSQIMALMNRNKRWWWFVFNTPTYTHTQRYRQSYNPLVYIIKMSV